MFLGSFKKEILAFLGPWFKTQNYATPSSNALQGKNVQYVRGQVGTRYGHSIVFTPTDGFTTSMFHWATNVAGAARSFLLRYVLGTGVQLTDLAATGSSSNIYPNSGGEFLASFASFGARVFMAFTDSSGNAASPGQVYSFGVGTDELFAPPLTIAPTFLEAGPGFMTAGVHRYGYVVTTRNGYTTKFSPAPSDVFTPVEFTSTGGMNVDAVFSGTFPAYASSVQLIMTTASNLNRYYFVPGAIFPIPVGGGFFFFNLLASISDDDLAADGTDATPFQGLLSQTVAGVAPFQPSCVFNYLNRMGYITVFGGVPTCFFSDSDNPQSLTADQHGVNLPGNLPIICGASARGVCYLFGPHYTYSTSDNGFGAPATWARPQLVDGSIGASGANCIFLNVASGYIWVADVSGLYLFTGGQYPAKPISYYQDSDWKAIDWRTPALVFVTDDKDAKLVSVIAPIDVPGTGSVVKILTWDYTDGTSAEQVKYSINTLVFADSYDWRIGCGAIVENYSTKRLELWLAPSFSLTTLDILRRNNGSETHPYRDVNSAIRGVYETALLPGLDGERGQIHMHHGDNLRVKGNGTLSVTPWALDHIRQAATQTLTLTANPGVENIVQYSLMHTEHATLEFSTNGVDEFFILSMVRHFYNPSIQQR